MNDTHVSPIKPEEVNKKKEDLIRPEVIEAFNELIIKNWHNERAVVMRHKVIGLIIKKLNSNKPNYLRVGACHIIDNDMLDIKSIFERSGWKVKLNDSVCTLFNSAYFEFKDAK